MVNRMADDDVAIRVERLSKRYEIYARPQDRLKQALSSKIRKLFGLPHKTYYSEYWALRDVSFKVRRGETIGVVGRNGAGKSTLLQLICGTAHPTCGSVEINGRVAALLELGSGFNPEFTGRENVFLSAAILGLKKQEIEAKYDAIAQFAGIGDFIDQPVKTYSSGMMLRLAFAVIAHVDADILVIDEALAVGDAYFTQKCMRFLKKFMETGTIFFVSHDTAAVANLCNKAIYLRDGELVEQGAPKRVIQLYLQSLYEGAQETNAVSIKDEPVARKELVLPMTYRDMRADLINQSNYRNDIEIFRFDPEKEGFGAGGARIVDVILQDAGGNALSWVVGGEKVVLKITCELEKEVVQPIIGFVFKDRMGQVIFSDNTYLAGGIRELKASPGSSLMASFHFVMPVLPRGHYAISPAIAEGTQEEHVQLHWLHDALILEAQSSSVCLGLVGLPMTKIEMEATVA